MKFRQWLMRVLPSVIGILGTVLPGLTVIQEPQDTSSITANIGIALASLLTAWGLSREQVQTALSGVAWIWKNINESHLPNGCVGATNWIADSLRRGVSPEMLKQFWDEQWQILVKECAPTKTEEENLNVSTTSQNA